MSLTIHLYYTGAGGAARQFAQEMMESGLVERIRRQAGDAPLGNYCPMEDPETVLLNVRWTDQQALDLHHQSEMMKEIAALREKYRLRLRVERYIDG